MSGGDAQLPAEVGAEQLEPAYRLVDVPFGQVHGGQRHLNRFAVPALRGEPLGERPQRLAQVCPPARAAARG
ncbi:hypothetical protein KBX53_22305, partial [Micromonospora sp. M51]|uniref:hypothetical protein n=1 Tax=Micromonospora sp. M51 TaxID=2824889 RepID=UPI001B394248